MIYVDYLIQTLLPGLGLGQGKWGSWAQNSRRHPSPEPCEGGWYSKDPSRSACSMCVPVCPTCLTRTSSRPACNNPAGPRASAPFFAGKETRFMEVKYLVSLSHELISGGARIWTWTPKPEPWLPTPVSVPRLRFRWFFLPSRCPRQLQTWWPTVKRMPRKIPSWPLFRLQRTHLERRSFSVLSFKSSLRAWRASAPGTLM